MNLKDLPIFQAALKLDEEGEFDKAFAIYDRILAQNPDHPVLLAMMATILAKSEHTLGLAISMFLRAIEKEKVPQYEIRNNLGFAYKFAGLRDQAVHWLRESIRVEENAGAYNSLASMFIENGDPTEGRKYAELAVKLSPDFAMAHWNLSLSILEQAHKNNEWGLGWDEYEWGEKEGGMRIKKKHVPLPDWDGTPGKKVLVYGEQGIGDEIMFASMIPDLMKTNEVILDCHMRLCTLFEKSFGVKCYGTRKNPVLDWLDVEKPDYMCAIGGLGKFFRRDRKDFPGTPYLKAEAEPRGKKFRVGISWTGGKLTGRVAKRTVPLSWWSTIFANDCEFVSLQYTEGCEKEIEICNKTLGTSITQHPAAKAEDYYELAKVAKSCDLIITVCTSLVHLAGALGVPCWVMVPKTPAWRYQTSGPMPWYRSVRLYRQPESTEEAWIPVVQTAGLALSDLLNPQQQKVA